MIRENHKIFLLLLLLITPTKVFSNGRPKRISPDGALVRAEISDFPSAVSAVLTTIKRRDDLSEYNWTSSQDGVLITMGWFLTTSSDEAREMVRAKLFSVIAGQNNRFIYGANKPGPFVTRAEHYNAKSNEDLDHLSLLEFKPPFPSNSNNIKPAKLPPRADFSAKCKRVTIVGWGETYELSSFVDKSEKSQLSRSEAEVIDCGDEYLPLIERAKLNHFCVKLIQENLRFRIADEGLPIFCGNDTLIGILQRHYGGEESLLFANSNKAYATNISHYMTWLRKTTGVKVPFESKPMYRITTTEKPTTKWPNDDDFRTKKGKTNFRPDGDDDFRTKKGKTNSRPDGESESSSETFIENSGRSLKADCGKIVIGIVIFLVGAF